MLLASAMLRLSPNDLLVAADEQFDPNQVTPGVAGFLVVAVLAVALSFLGIDLVRRIRRSRYRSEIREEIAQELSQGTSTTE